MVTMYGMCEIGPWTLTDPTTQSSDVVLRMLARNSMSEKLAGYKVIDTVGFNAKHCVVIKFSSNSLFCVRYYSYSF
jgi:hypothetical protein